MTPRDLPSHARELCQRLAAPARLIAHLTLVHDVAHELLDALQKKYPRLNIGRDAILFGAATHDLGKTRHTNELSEPGTQHEQIGEAILRELGVAPSLARFARTHGNWRDPSNNLEDLLVSLADAVWKGKRDTELEALVSEKIGASVSEPQWDVWSRLDNILDRLAARSDDRLEWQRRHRA